MPTAKQFALDPKNATPVLIIACVLMLVVPLPTFLLDMGMSLNFLFSLLVLLKSATVRKSIDFGSYPSLLLYTTMFTIALNVSSTRLILTKGEKFDGAMINAFAHFVTGSTGRGSLLVGFIMFIILFVVQAMVISSGASRISEVRARFTLDAMQVKNMSIDSEFSSGAITFEEAEKRKHENQLEVDFYSTMDGASKFVSGNVKLGIVTTVINLVAGLILGMVVRREPFQRALGMYAQFTIGDGLMGQMPSLFVSLASGFLITQGNTAASLGEKICDEFSQDGIIYIVSGAVLCLMGFLPRFPIYILEPMGAFLIFAGLRIRKTKSQAEFEKANAKSKKEKSQSSTERKSVDLTPPKPVAPIAIHFGYALQDLVKNGDIAQRIGNARHFIAQEFGFVLPEILCLDNISLDPNEYCILLYGVPVAKAIARAGSLLCIETDRVTEKIPGEKTEDPIFHRPAIWVPEIDRDEAEHAGYTVIGGDTLLMTHLLECIKAHAAELLDLQAVNAMLDALQEKHSALVNDIREKLKDIGASIYVQKVLRSLLAEQISIANIVTILETILTYASFSGKQIPIAAVMAEKVRQALGRQICDKFCGDDGILHVFTVSRPFLDRLREWTTFEQATTDAVVNWPNEGVAGRWEQGVSDAIDAAESQKCRPVILVDSVSRICVKQSIVLSKALQDKIGCGISAFPVLSVSEIPSSMNVEILGEINIEV